MCSFTHHMCEWAVKDRIRNKSILEHLGTALIGDKLRESFEVVWTCLGGKVSLCMLMAPRGKGVDWREHGWK